MRCGPPTASRRWCPAGAHVIDPVGTAPGAGGAGEPTVVVLPGPPRELQPMWGTAVASEPCRRRSQAARSTGRRWCGCSGCPSRGSPRRCVMPRRAVDGFAELEITTCLRRARWRWSPATSPRPAPVYRGDARALRERHARQIFSEDGLESTIRWPQLLAGRRVATAESCTAGLVAARLTERPGSSDYVAGGVVAYSNEAKSGLLGVDPALIEAHGAVSEPVAEAMADGALRRFEADTAVAITGIAGPGGGTEEKPVGTVCWCVQTTDGRGITRDPPPAGQPRRHPGPLDHRRDAPAAPRAARRAPRPKLPKRRRQPRSRRERAARPHVPRARPSRGRSGRCSSGGATGSLQPAPTCGRCARRHFT